MKNVLTRRNVLIGAGGAAVLAGAAYEASRLLSKRYAPSPYDDLLARLNDRDADAQIGETVLAELNGFDAKTAAAELRAKLQHATLAQASAKDVAEGRLVEAHGWVLPETLGLLCALAAKAAA
jgi:hypothetical protein